MQRIKKIIEQNLPIVLVFLLFLCFCFCAHGLLHVLVSIMGCCRCCIKPRRVESAIENDNDDYDDYNYDANRGKKGRWRGSGGGDILPTVSEKLNHLSNTPTVTKMNNAISAMSSKLGIDPNNSMELGAYSQVNNTDAYGAYDEEDDVGEHVEGRYESNNSHNDDDDGDMNDSFEYDGTNDDDEFDDDDEFTSLPPAEHGHIANL